MANVIDDSLPLGCKKGYEKETLGNRHPVYVDVETPANAGIFIVPEALHCGNPLFFTQKDCVGVLHELMDWQNWWRSQRL